MRRTFVVLLLVGCATARAQEPALTPVRASGTSMLFAIPTDSDLKCTVHRPPELDARADGKIRFEYVFGDEPLPHREIHVEVDSARRLSAIADMIYEGEVSAGGAMVTAGAVFSAEADRGMLVRASLGDPSQAGTSATRASQSTRPLTSDELSAARALGMWLLQRGCQASEGLTVN